MLQIESMNDTPKYLFVAYSWCFLRLTTQTTFPSVRWGLGLKSLPLEGELGSEVVLDRVSCYFVGKKRKRREREKVTGRFVSPHGIAVDDVGSDGARTEGVTSWYIDIGDYVYWDHRLIHMASILEVWRWLAVDDEFLFNPPNTDDLLDSAIKNSISGSDAANCDLKLLNVDSAGIFLSSVDRDNVDSEHHVTTTERSDILPLLQIRQMTQLR
ncbi:hypothetical protein Tco_1146128 [Tanacetum coccineum]